jgi:hypothetical protein
MTVLPVHFAAMSQGAQILFPIWAIAQQRGLH